MKRLAAFLIAMVAVAAQAQVIKCTNPKTGQVIYSDRQCENGNAGALVERRKTHEEVMSERLQAAEANEQKYRNRLAEMELQQQSAQRAPISYQQNRPDKSASYECRLAQKNHATTASSTSGTAEQRRNNINASTVGVNAACDLTTEMIQEPTRKRQISNSANSPTTITHCNSGFCYDNLGGVYHRNGPTFMTGPNGQTCHGSGTIWSCN